MRIAKSKSVDVKVRTLKIRKYLSKQDSGCDDYQFNRKEIMKVRR